MCDSCRHSEQKIIDSLTIGMYPRPCKRLTKWCNKNTRYVNKMVSYEKSQSCGYIPKAGKIDKKTTQKGITEY
jgi:hypothetical protein